MIFGLSRTAASRQFCSAIRCTAASWMRAALRWSSVNETLELIEQRPREKFSLSEIDEPEVAHVLPGNAANVLGLHLAQLIDESVRRAKVAFVDLGAGEHRGLIAIR